jgi:hypothetical protein
MILVIPEVILKGGVGLAQFPSPDLTMQYDQHSFNIEIDNANLKQVLARLAAIADITIEYPVALDRSIILHRRGITIEDALSELSFIHKTQGAAVLCAQLHQQDPKALYAVFLQW